MKLKDVTTIISGGTPSTKKAEYWNGSISWITPKDLSGYNKMYISKGERNITDSGLKNSSAYLIPKGSVLFSSRAPIGYVAIADNELCTNQGFKNFICDKSKIDNIYLYYWLKNNVKTIEEFASGSTFKEISGSKISNIEIELPSLITQKKISNILSSLDKKIELNNEINNTLHAILKNIYEDWFINYNYPYAKEELHRNWITNRLGEYLNIERGLSYKGEFLSDDGVPMINLGNVMPDGVFRLEKNKYYSGEYKEKVTAKSGDIVIANTDITQDRAVIGSPVIIPNVYNSNIIYSHHIYGVKNLKLPRMFVFYTLLRKEFRAIAGGSATGTTVLALPKDVIENYEIEIPDKFTLEAFSNIAETIYKKREILMLQNIKLEQLRDTLLPKLMNGEIDLDSIKV